MPRAWLMGSGKGDKDSILGRLGCEQSSGKVRMSSLTELCLHPKILLFCLSYMSRFATPEIFCPLSIHQPLAWSLGQPQPAHVLHAWLHYFFFNVQDFLGVNPSTQLSSAQIYPEVTLSQEVTQQYSPIEVQLGALWRWGPRDGGSEVRLLPITTCSAPEGSQSSSALCHKQGCCPSWGYFRVFLTVFTTFSCLLARFGNQMRCLFYPSISPSLHKEK